MKLNAYSVYDRKGLIYNAPFFTHTDGSALRSFADLANDLQTTVGRHPADYVLYRVGAYDDQSAQLIGHEPAHVADALSLLTSNGDLFAKGPIAQPDLSNGKAK